jgi:hypothetical protein
MRRFLRLAGLAFVASYTALQAMPDLKRYIKIRRM